MRRLVILALLYLGVQLMLPLGEQGHGSEALVTFGFLILAGRGFLPGLERGVP